MIHSAEPAEGAEKRDGLTAGLSSLMASGVRALWSCDLVSTVVESLDDWDRHHKVNASGLQKYLNVKEYFNQFIIYIKLINIHVFLFLMWLYNIFA